jgi:hypothetical protein
MQMIPELRFGIIKCLSVIAFLITTTSVHGQTQINCCGIDQSIPIFKTDTNSSYSQFYSPLTAKNLLQPIEKSPSQLEIRVNSMSLFFEETICIIKCDSDKIRLTKYETMMMSAEDTKEWMTTGRFKTGKNIGPEHPGDKLTTLVKTTDLTRDNELRDWNAVFHRLISDHLFDLPEGQKYIDSVRALTSPLNYPEGEYDNIVEVKVGNQVRHLRYDGGYSDNIDIVKHCNDIINLIAEIFKW